MSAQSELFALVDRVEALTGPCRETDVAVALAKGWIQTGDGWFRPANVDVRHHITEMPRYTASLDTAMTLYIRVPELVASNPRKAAASALRQRAESL